MAKKEKLSKSLVIVESPAKANTINKILGKDFYYEVFNEKDELRSDRIITVNGRNVKDVGSLRLKDGDRIAIFPPIAGG